MLFDLLLPEPPQVRQLQTLSVSELGERIKKSPPVENVGIQAIFDYRDPLMKRLIWEIKYRGNRQFIKKAAALFYDELVDILAEEKTWRNFKNPSLVPIPLSKKRFRERGFNQCEEICKELATLDTGAFFSLDLFLVRTRHTEKQTGASKKDREKNLHGCFAVAEGLSVKDKNIILFDDVTTTGATLKEAVETLKKAGARKIIALALAH